MDTALLKTFLVLASTKNFTSTAQKLHRSQSATSLQIHRLEALIGKTLFERNKRNVSLTSDGEALLGYAKKMVNLEEELLAHFHQPLLQGEVSFGTPEDLATAYLPQILSRFRQSYPGILLNVHCEFTLNLLQGFEAHTYDIVLVKQDPHHPHPQSELVKRESLVWVGKRRHKVEKTLSLVLSPSPCVYRQRALEALNRSGIAWRIAYSSPSLTGTIAAVEAGLGVTVLPRQRIPKGLQIIEHLPPLTDAQVALLKQSGASPIVDMLATYIVDHVI